MISAEISGDVLPLWIREGQCLVPHVPEEGEVFARKHDAVPSGFIRVTVSADWGLDHEWRETPIRPLDMWLGHIYRGIILAAADRKRQVARRDARRGQWEEEERR